MAGAFTSREKARLVELWPDRTIRECARIMRRTQTEIWGMSKELGLPPRPTGQPKDHHVRQRVRDLTASGMSGADIGRRLGLTPSRVSQLRTELGIAPRKQAHAPLATTTNNVAEGSR